VGFLKYLKGAFLNRWNLLAFLGGMGFALLSPWPDVAVSLVAAAEVAYLGFLGTHPKFQKYVEAQEAKATRQEGNESAELVVRRILGALPRPLVQRFEQLRARCQELRQIATEMRDPHQIGTAAPLEEMQLASLDRLLWSYLRLLFTQHSLERFMQKADERQIQQDIKDAEVRLKALPREADDPRRQKIRKLLEDNLETCRARLANFQKARENYELVQMEINRLENKIRSLSELAVNRQEPDFISGQVDQVIASMVQTERTMSELQSITGLEGTDEQVPQMLRRETTQVRA
jgi:hypothetical protein